MGIDVTKYFKIHRDECSRIFAIETVGDERELIKEIRKQNEQLHRYKQAIEEIKEIAEQEVNTRMCFADKKSFCDFNKILKIIQKCEEVNKQERTKNENLETKTI